MNDHPQKESSLTELHKQLNLKSKYLCFHYKSLTKKHKSTIDVNKFTNQHERTVKNLKEIEVKIFRIY